MDIEEIKMMRVSDLAFDFENPRLVEFGLTENATEEEVIQVLWEAMDVRELMMSIAASGFFRHEPLIVAKEHGKNVVIEGNRRLAAVKVLLNPALANHLNVTDSDIADEDRAALAELPTLKKTRRDAWRFLGFKHVNGPAKWSSYAKSQYIANVHRKFGIGLEDIAKQIGDTHKTVQRLYRGLMVIEQAEKLSVFDREDRWYKGFYFSHLYTGIGYAGISDFIGLEAETDEKEDPVPIEKKQELRELFLWMYGSRREDIPPVIQRQNPHLSQLEAVVSNREALSILRVRGYAGLGDAYEASRPSSNVFEEFLHEAKSHLEKARGLLSAGYDGSEQLLRTAGTVANLADDLYDEMERKRNPGRKKRIAEGG